MKSSTRSSLIGLIVLLAVGVIFTQRMLDPRVREMHKGEKTNVIGLSNEFILGPMLGLQQAVAGMLWVRGDEFFHEGDYDAILPIVRMVTWLDPHSLDVYITGAWHLAYNFTDSNERSDRRYIPAAQALLREGDENNHDVYDIAFELGWQNEDKIKNYEQAEYWFRQAAGRKGTDQNGVPGQPPPMFVTHMIAHSLEKQGRIMEAMDVWRQAIAASDEKLKNAKDAGYALKNVRDSEKHNLELGLKRYYSRYVHEINYKVDKERTRSIDMKTGEPNPKDAYIATDASEGIVGQPRPAATAKPWETAFDCRPTFPQPKVLDIVKGQFAVGDGARVSIVLHDEDWRPTQLKEFTFDIDQSQTIMMDQHSVRDYKWGRKVDMSKDPKMYSFSRPTYYLVFEFDPRGTSPHVQDKFGWSGEGMTDKKYLVVKKTDHPGQPDDRIIRKVYYLTREQIMGVKPVTEANVLPNAEYDRIQQHTASAR